MTLLGEMEALAGRLPAGDVRRIDARREIGWTYYVSGARVQAIPVLVAAVKDVEANDRLPAAQRASWELASKTYRALGIVYRAQRRDKEAVPAFGQAVERTAAAKPQGASETRRHAMTLARNLQELATTQCRIGQTGEAQKNFERVRAVCKPPINPATTWFCRPERLRCPAR